MATAPDTIRAAFRQQAQFCWHFDAPFTGLICEAVADAIDDSSATGRALLDWSGEPMRDALPMRMTGGLNALARRGALGRLGTFYPPAPLADVAEVAAALAEALADPAIDAAVHAWLAGPPQTNEVARSGALMPGLMVIAKETGLPLRLFELGTSAGLNLWLDRWRYDLGGQASGPVDSGVHIAPAWQGPPPPAARVDVLARRGVDIAPLDITDPATRERLLAYVWPDQPARVARAEAAIAFAAAQPPAIDRADAADWLDAHVHGAAGSVAVVFHSIAFQYFLPESRQRIAATLAARGAAATGQAPLAWLRLEMDDPTVPAFPTLRLTLWRGGAADERLLARAHPHGSSVAWLG